MEAAAGVRGARFFVPYPERQGEAPRRKNGGTGGDAGECRLGGPNFCSLQTAKSRRESA